MKKIAWVFIVAVIVPSLLLAWLAMRSLRDQQFLIERQQAAIFQSTSDDAAKRIGEELAAKEETFSIAVDELLIDEPAPQLAPKFDERIRETWPDAEVGFSVTLDTYSCPSPPSNGRPEGRDFRIQNLQFLCSTSPDEVYWSPKDLATLPQSKQEMLKRKVTPQGAISPNEQGGQPNDEPPDSSVTATRVAFHEIVGEGRSGMLARFLQDELNVWTWHRNDASPNMVFGAKLDLSKVQLGLNRLLIENPSPGFTTTDICLAVINDKGLPVAQTHAGFSTDWSRPFVATEIGGVLPHWEVAVYLLNPGNLTQSAQTAKLTLGLLIGVLILAIGGGSWMIVANLNRELALARQKTDFVSNVSHELKTPLTSIRMFSELLTEGRAETPEKAKKFLGIIAAETARLTRLINNVLDFSRMERGEKKYEFVERDLSQIVEEVAESCRPNLESGGFKFEVEIPGEPVTAMADSDAVSQIIMNLLSNAEKYSGGDHRITLRLVRDDGTTARVQVLDRGIGVPKRSTEKIFEKFFRATDSLDSGIEGSGLGLTLARQIARAHGGDVNYAPREGGGSVFTFQIPLVGEHKS